MTPTEAAAAGGCDEVIGMPWNEFAIAAAIARQTLQSRCLLLVDRCNWTGHECDVLGVTTCLRIIDVEVKISRADLRADAKKDKWWVRQFGRWSAETQSYVKPPDVLRPWPPRGWKHYYALPADIWNDDLLAALPSKASGVLLLHGKKDGRVVVTCKRRSTPDRNASRLTAEQVVDIARLANLRMWDAYKRLENMSTPIGVTR